ncbi:MAG: hypothetical protein JWM91_227 [Rhodospirillales bacterium]|nr:hypothetical protein [Rhodospirillales bacterium]
MLWRVCLDWELAARFLLEYNKFFAAFIVGTANFATAKSRSIRGRRNEDLLPVLCTFLRTRSSAGRAADGPACGLKRIAEMETKIEDEHLRVKVQINDRNVWFDVTLAGPISLIRGRLVDQMKLPKKDVTANVIDGNGRQVRKFAITKKLSFAGRSTTDVLIVNPRSDDPDDRDFEGSRR